ncbi:MAG: glycosyltransferase family 2 protein [Coriobacteriia bacterium]
MGAVAAAVAYGAYYIVWRVAAGTVDMRAWYLGIPLIAIEAFACYQLFLAFVRMRADTRGSIGADAVAHLLAACSLDSECFTVDVLLPTYDEPSEVLEQTIRAARDIAYPHETFVLDDGTRSWVEELCVQEEVRYVTRPDRAHFKAGNINHALGVSEGEFLVVLDADFIALPNLIGAFLLYFDDERVAVVQGPQAFYNVDSFQHSRDGSWNDQTHFFRTVLPAKAQSNSAFWCGTPAMLRRAALESIGGVSTHSITEDIETSLVLESQGWVIGYHNETVAVGQAPANIEGFMTQRLRWGRGALQLLATRRFNPLVMPDLKPRQRLEYLESMSFWFQGWLFSLEYLIPPVVLVFAVSPVAFTVTPMAFFVRWGTFTVLFIAANYVAAPRTFRFLETSMYRPLYTLIHITVGLDALARRRPAFKVTSKSLNARSLFRPFLAAMYVVAAVMLGSLTYRLLVEAGIAPGVTGYRGLFVMAGAFALYFAVVFLLLARRITVAAREKRRYFRRKLSSAIAGTLLADDERAPVAVVDLSLHGALLSLEPLDAAEVLATLERLSLLVELPGGTLEASVTLRSLTPSPGLLFAGVEFGSASDEHQRLLEAYLAESLAVAEHRYDDRPAAA